MDYKKLILLINKEIDNEISSDEKKLLTDEINSNAKSKKLYDDLKSTAKYLVDDNSEYELDITEEVLGKIDPTKYKPKAKKDWLFLTSSIFNLRFPMAFSLGVIAGVVVISILFATGLFNVSETGLTGTMSSSDAYGNFTKADEIQINQNNVTGSISTQYQADMLIADVRLNSSENLRIDFLFNDKNISLYSIKPIGTNSEAGFLWGRNYIKTNNAGENKFLILFKNNYNGEDIRLKLVSGSGQENEYKLATKN